MSNPPRTLTQDQIAELYRLYAASAVERYNETGECPPAVILCSFPEAEEVVSVELPGHMSMVFFSGTPEEAPLRKNMLAALINDLLTVGCQWREKAPLQPDAIVLINEVWMSKAKHGDLDVQIAPSLDPNRKEGIVVKIITTDASWGGMNHISGNPKKAFFSRELKKLAHSTFEFRGNVTRH